MANRGGGERPDDNLEYMGSPATNPAGGAGRMINGATGAAGTRAEDDFQAPAKNAATDSTPPYTRAPTELPPGEDPPSRSPNVVMPEDEQNQLEAQYSSFGKPETWLIQKSYEIYTASSDYLDANITNQWERNLAHFKNEHAPGTPFRRQNFKRSRVFRPKTRANIKAQEAALAHAAFSTADYVDIQPQDDTNEMQVVSAQINKELLSYRLDRRMPWFQTCMGAYQDTKNYGLCITHQLWRYEIDTDIQPAFDDFGKLIIEKDSSGGDVPMGRETVVVRKDELGCDNVAPENFRFDPMCDWRDPVQSSPFLIYMMPIYAGEALERMESVDPKTGQPRWMTHSLAAILGTRRQDYDRTRQAREGRERIDPADEQHGNSFTTVWAHMNIVKINGEDWMWWTMGTELLLTPPVRLAKAYPHLDQGSRPFQVGFSTIETHRNYPAGDVEQTAGLQEEINLVTNQRLDNVKLALNKRYYVRRGSQVDLNALIRNVPGGGVMMNDPEKDVKTVETRDVTASSYNEQDRLSTEFDDLAGGVSQASMAQSKGMGETVGKTNMVSMLASSVGDYSLRIFMETWMEPVLRDLVRCIQYYETDQVLLGLAASRLQLYQKFGVDKITDSLLMQDLTIRVNLGIGNTDPVRRVEKLVYGVAKTLEIPGMAERAKPSAISNEIWGAMGYRDASRFFMSDEEYDQKLEEQGDPPPPPEILVKQEELGIRQEDNQMRDKREMHKLDKEHERALMELALKEQLTYDEMFAKLEMDGRKDKTARDLAALKGAQTTEEFNMKRATGSGI